MRRTLALFALFALALVPLTLIDPIGDIRRAEARLTAAGTCEVRVRVDGVEQWQAMDPAFCTSLPGGADTPTAAPPTATTSPPTATAIPPTATAIPPTSVPTAIPTATPPAPCAHDPNTWHPPVSGSCVYGHEHGIAPPAWVMASTWPASFSHPGNTPNENEQKHTAFKGFLVTDDGVTVYVIMHLDTNPSGHASRFHSVQVWALDAAGGISHWDYWLDFGSGTNTGPNLRGNGGCESTSIRPIMAVNYTNCGSGLSFESWYSAPGQSPSGWDFGFNSSPNYYAGVSPSQLSNPDLAAIGTWLPTGGNNFTRRIELAHYTNSPRGTFYANQWGQRVSGPNDPSCGTQVAIGAKTYTVLCLEQHIANTMTTVTFPSNSVQRVHDGTGVVAPN